ncbi:TetR/AcrR family transcriptional regulator [Streptomyces sp. NBC_00988]|uniref:TetR/AcrR family transcriptional regulator n=1 Tax=Streptomyces sp. NBC_00988 TaxID=2903704 RepID=UPI0038640106|nr:TetR/AcrR family transcriptional regulator [Streptomyces sp. NBC_00988]
MAELAEPGRPPLRRDAELNRRRLMTAAREVFRDRGLAATLDDVARHAGLGVGTAYRHFSNKEELVDAVFEDMIDQVEASAREAAADPDPWHGLASSLEKVCELQAHDRGLREVMLGTGKAAQRHALVDRRIKPLVDPLIERAKEQGALRPDVEPLDLPMIQLMVAAVTDQTGEPDLWRRYLRLLLDGMRTQPDGTELLPPVPEFRGIGVAADPAGEKPPRP